MNKNYFRFIKLIESNLGKKAVRIFGFKHVPLDTAPSSGHHTLVRLKSWN